MVAILRQNPPPGHHLPDFRAIALPAFSDNYLWLLADARDRVVVVDPGDASLVLKAAAEGLTPEAVLITHHHPDHIGGLGELLADFDIPCYAPMDARIPHAQQRVNHGETIHIPAMKLSLNVIGVPGHTRSHLAYLADDHLFCGDALFSLGCGRLFEGSAGQMLQSLDRLAALPDATNVYCAHEYTLANARFAKAAEPNNPDRDHWLNAVAERLAIQQPSLPSTIAIEKRCNPFLRCDQEQIIANVATHNGSRPADRLETFTALRRWKDGFQ